MQKNRVFSIITIICFCTVILVPLGLALMWFSTEWKKKLKIILTSVLGLLYIVLVVLFLLIEPSYNTGGIGLPGGYSGGYTAFDSGGGKKTERDADKDGRTKKNGDGADFEPESPRNNGKNGEKNPEQERLPRSMTRQRHKGNGQAWYAVLFFLLILALIIIQNLVGNRKKHGYENPYVDTNQYKLPLLPESKLPMVHFLGLRLAQGERILFAVNTVQKDNEGDFVVTSQRVLLYSKQGDCEFPLSALTAITSVSNSVLQLTSGDRKYYIFVPENQMKYALAVVRWAYAKFSDGFAKS